MTKALKNATIGKVKGDARYMLTACICVMIFKEDLTMNKAELVAAVADKTNSTKKDAESAINAFLETVEKALVKGEKVQLIGFGTFETRKRKARQGRNPRKPDEIIKIPASKAPVFKAGKALKDAIN